MRSTGELLYLLMVIGAFTSFMIALAWGERTWRPKHRRERAGTLPQAAE